MATVDTVQRFVMCGLQAQLQPDLVALFFVLAEQVQHRVRYAVRAGSHAQPNDTGLADGLLIHRSQYLHLRPRAGVSLKIGQILLRTVHQAGLVGKLLSDRVMLLCFIGKRRDVTEGAATAPDGAVAIRAAKPAVQRQLMNLLPVPLQKIPTKHID